MPWNDNANPGPWGSPSGGDGDRRDPPRRPQGGGPRGPGRGGGPDFNVNVERLIQRLRELMGGPGGMKPSVLFAILGGAFGLWALSGFYIVQPNEQAVVTTFGAYSRSETPGLRYHVPFPVERVEKVAVTTLNRTDVGSNGDNEAPAESLMLTGDEQIVDLDFSVTWRISDPSKYLFSVRDPKLAVKDVAESAMREVVGKIPLQPLISTERGQVQQRTAELMQKTLDSWNTGISIVEVQIRSADPPQEVAGDFREVNNAVQDADSYKNEADTYANRVVNEAKGDASRIIQAAEAYREQAVREATGETARFNQLYAEYKRAPGVTRDRLYIESMQRILQRTNKVVIDAKGATAPIILPPDVFRPKGSASTSAPAIQPQVSAPTPQPQAKASQ
ncbi:MAG: FtsH protease activity modulator HflK [Phenylobacterium sp.]|uniref:FtsH protease activity modulator HflK n=1 Tax=Phenylobacterium sp. TaxID=1871053 RepID=UPI0025FE3E85|nr:FtsH protease activity modulator HflK [Phenylobacterium sp.]MBI1199403.1 FtsH protease activity modulator HflK [Phenylobacterium sp.]